MIDNNKRIMRVLAQELATDRGKERFSELSDDFTLGVTGVNRDLADVLAVEEIARDIDEDVQFDNLNDLAREFDARKIINAYDAEDIQEALEVLF